MGPVARWQATFKKETGILLQKRHQNLKIVLKHKTNPQLHKAAPSWLTVYRPWRTGVPRDGRARRARQGFVPPIYPFVVVVSDLAQLENDNTVAINPCPRTLSTVNPYFEYMAALPYGWIPDCIRTLHGGPISSDRYYGGVRNTYGRGGYVLQTWLSWSYLVSARLYGVRMP